MIVPPPFKPYERFVLDAEKFAAAVRKAPRIAGHIYVNEKRSLFVFLAKKELLDTIKRQPEDFQSVKCSWGQGNEILFIG